MDFLLIFFVGLLMNVVSSLPNPNGLDEIDQNSIDKINEENDIINNIHYSETRPEQKKPYGSLSEILENGIFTGVHYLDNAVPRIEKPSEKPIKQVDKMKLKAEENNSTITIPEDESEIKIRLERGDSKNKTKTTSLINNDLTKLQQTTISPQTTTTQLITFTIHPKQVHNIESVLKQINDAIIQITKDPNPSLLMAPSIVKAKNSTEYLTEKITNLVKMLMTHTDETTGEDLANKLSGALDGVLDQVKSTHKEMLWSKGNIDTGILIQNGTVVTKDYDTSVNTTELILKIKDEMEEVKADVIKRDANRINGTKLTLGELFEKNGTTGVRYVRDDDDNSINDVTETSLDNNNAVEDVGSNENGNDSNDKQGNGQQQSGSQSGSQSSSSEEGGLIGNLLSSFLGGLSKPDGGVDVDALVGLIGGLSMEQEDGSYNFDGLSELLQGLLGGDEDGGGSDVGAFLGGLLGALIKGSANPPGAQGVGIFTGNVVANILPGLSAGAPAGEGEATTGKPGLDSGGFLSGILSSMLGGSSGSGANEGGGGSPGIFTTIKNGLFKTIFGLITSIFTSSSGSGGGAKH